jgi:hypothetical protein
MATIPDASKQLVIAMAVFDQNADDLLPQIAREVHRVLSPDGVVAYIHNEELNLPATAASFLHRSAGQTLLLPSDRWLPTNDLEYCSGSREAIETWIWSHRDDSAPLVQFLQGVYPQLYRVAEMQPATVQVGAPFVRQCTFPVLNRIRRVVGRLREEGEIRLEDHCSSELLKNHVEDRMFSASHGFDAKVSGIFEMRRAQDWRLHFPQGRPATYFVRGIGHFGYVSNAAPTAVRGYEQELNRNPVPGDDEVVFVAYQYGMVATKRSA